MRDLADIRGDFFKLGVPFELLEEFEEAIMSAKTAEVVNLKRDLALSEQTVRILDGVNKDLHRDYDEMRRLLSEGSEGRYGC